MKSLKNKGFTLIEMVVAFAVLGVAVFGIGGFFVSAARSYSSVSDETSLQYEAQLALNQVESMLIDSTLGVSYNFVKSGATATNGGYQFVEKDSEASGAAVSKVLYAYNVGASAGLLDIMMLKWDDNEKAIYYTVQQVSNPGPAIDTIDVSSTLSGWDLLAEDVETFSVDLSEYTKTKKVEIKLGFENRSKDYETSGTVVLRNNVLINEMDIGKIYDRISWAPPSTITGIGLTSNMDVTVPGGAVQLYTNVLGDGYPETKIEQYQWIVAKDSAFTNIIYDSLINYDEANSRPATYVDTSNKVLRVSADTTGEGSDFNETLWVKVVAITNDKDEDDNPIKLSSTALSIGVKLINNIVVSVAADTSQSYNSNLANTSFEKASWTEQKVQSPKIPTMTLVPRNVVQLTGAVTSSDSIAPEDKAILWSIHSVGEGVDAEISSTGLLKIRQYSKKGNFIVRATLKMDSMVYVEYIVQVVDEYSVGNAKLEIVAGESILNRGGNVKCGLMLNDEEVDNSDYDWSVKILSSNGQELTGKPVAVNSQGEVSANYELSYDYSYDVYVSATLKTNPGVTATTRITIPKVSLQLNPPTKFSNMGTTVSGITCTAVGLEEYDIQWTMAKASNPKYFFTAWGNFTITGSKNSNGTANATVVMGTADDPKTNCTVKAYLKNNTNYSATMKIFTGSIEMSIVGSATKMKPGETLNLNVSVSGDYVNQVEITKETVTWEITKMTINDVEYKNWEEDGIRLTNGSLYVPETFGQNQANKKIKIYIKAYDTNYNLESKNEYEVTVNVIQLKVEPDMILIPDGNSQRKLQYTHYEGAGWTVTPSDNYVYFDRNSRNPGELTILKDNGGNISNNKVYTVIVSLNGESKEGKLHYGFETSRQYNSLKEYDTDWWDRPEKAFKIGTSQYSALNTSNQKCSVYYIEKVEYTYDRMGNGTETSKGQYAFVASSGSGTNGSGQWYKYDSSGKKWSTTSAPSEWDNKYFMN